MMLKARELIANVVDPEWRNDRSVTALLEHQARLRADPERQRLMRHVNMKARRELARHALLCAAILLSLLLGVVSWFADVPLTSVLSSPVVQRLAVLAVLCAGVVFLVGAGIWRRR